MSLSYCSFGLLLIVYILSISSIVSAGERNKFSQDKWIDLFDFYGIDLIHSQHKKSQSVIPIPSYGLGFLFYDKIHLRASIGFMFAAGAGKYGIYYNTPMSARSSWFVGLERKFVTYITTTDVSYLLTFGRRGRENESIEFSLGYYERQGCENTCTLKENSGYQVSLGFYQW